MKKLKISTAPPWIIGTIGLFASATASASSYAVSTDSITNFSITGIPSTSFGGFTFSGDFALSLGDLTGISAHLTTQDALAACVGSYCSGVQNEFYSHGVSPSPGYAYADAKIYNTNVLGAAGSASTIGEVTVYDGAAGSTSANAMHAVFSLGGAAAVNFSFNALPFMSTQLMSGGTGANGAIGMGVTIKKFGNTVFQWAPDGVVTGTEVFDPFSLNKSIGNNLTYSPGSGFFKTSTSLLAGSYTLDIAMANAVTATSTTVVPVPAALPLFGSGMAALAVLAKRRKRIQA